MSYQTKLPYLGREGAPNYKLWRKSGGLSDSSLPPRSQFLPALITAAVSVSAVLVSILLMQHACLPLPSRDVIRSSTLVLGQFPYKVHVAFAIGLLTTVGVTLATIWIKWPERSSVRLSVLLFSVVVAIWALNSASCHQGRDFGLSGDPLHEGEYFGFRQSYLQGGLDDCLVIHGPALNILPGVVAGPYRDNGYSIAVARLCRSVFGLFAMAGYLWILWELARWYTDNQTGPVFRLLVVGVIALEGILYMNTRITGMGPFRDAVFYLSLALLLRWLNAGASRPGRDLICGLILGIVTAAGPLVSYERGVSWPIVLVFSIAVAAAFRGRGLAWLVAGLMMGGGTTALLLKHELYVALSQARYWTKFGDLMFALPVEINELRWNPYLLSQFMVLFGALSWMVQDLIYRETTFRNWLREQSPLLILLLVAVLTERRVLARGDIPHYQVAGMPIALVLAAVVLLIGRCHAGLNGISWLTSGAFQMNRLPLMLTVAALLVLVRPNCSPLIAVQYISDWKSNHSKLSDQTRDILAGIYRHGPLGPRDFYPLDCAGVWFYLTSTSSPSRFHQLFYAMPEASQRQVVNDLERHHTRVILEQPEGWKFDWVPPETMFSIVKKYIDDHYTIAEVIHGYRVLVRHE